jgi:glycosyltransferase involved in cell wall biosynthesis
MTPKKAPILTLKAFQRAVEINPNLRLDFVGDGPLFPVVSEFVTGSGLGDRVTLHGSQPADAVAEFLNKSDIFLQHSITDPQTGDEEGMPVVILEAMAQSLPVVSTRHSGIAEAIVEGETGYLVDEGDHLGMSDHILRLAGDAGLRRKLGEAGWRRCGDLYSWQKGRVELQRVLGLSD